MRIEVSRDEYNDAIGEALGIIAERRGSLGDTALEVVLANVWDPTADGNVFDFLMSMDIASQEIALCLAVGRTRYGRPSNHPRAAELEDLHYRATSRRKR